MSVLAQGSMEGTPFAKTLFTLAERRITGMVTINHGGREYQVGLASGQLVYARSPDPADHVGRIALRAGLTDKTQLGQLLSSISAQADRDPVDVLAEGIGLEEAQTNQLRQHTLAQAAIRPFALPAGEFEITDSLPPSVAPPVAMEWVVYSGVKTHLAEEQLRTDLGALGKASVSLSAGGRESLSSFGFGQDERPILEALLEPGTVAEAIQRSGQDTRSALTVIYALYFSGGLDVSGAASATSSAPSRGAAAVEPSPPPQAADPNPRADSPAAKPATTQPAAAKTPTADPAAAKSAAGKPARAPRAKTPTSTPDGQNTTVKVKRKTKADPGEVNKLIEEKLSLLRSKPDHFQLLGVEQGASAGELQKAYFQLAKHLHPDRLRALQIGADPKKTQDLFAKINIAFGVLSNPGKRTEYMKVLAAGGEEAMKKKQAEAEQKAANILNAEEHFLTGEMALRRNQYKQALEQFGHAVRLNPEEGEHLIFFAWAQWLADEAKDKDFAVETTQQIEKALKMSPKCAPGYFFLGQLAKHQGKQARARELFEKVLQLRPSDREAQLELRLMSSRGG